MPIIDLNELSARESERVEWKENVADVEDVVRTICAFSNDYANMGGGYVVCGAREEKDEHGFQRVRLTGLDSARFKEVEGRVLSGCRDYMDPPVTPIVEEIPTNDPARRILVFVVPATRRAHGFRGKTGASPAYYIRVGRETVVARNGLFRELMVRKGDMEPWDRRASNATIEEVDLLVLREYLKRMGVWSGDRPTDMHLATYSAHRELWDDHRWLDEILSPSNQLSAFAPPLVSRESLTNVLRPRNFAMLLFGRNPLKVAPGAHVVISFYPGNDRSESIAQRHELTGSILSQAEAAIKHLASEVGTIFDKEGARPNLVKYPQRALNEAIVNAIVHRDYEIDQPVRITVFRNRIEILSPGALPSAVPADKFVKGTASPFWRNQALSYFFNKMQLAQAEGQGIPTILATMRSEGCPDPQFDLEPERLITTLPAHPQYEELRTRLRGS